jgi:hypothetical protein
MCNQETSRYMGIMPYLISIYKNDFVKDFCENLASHSVLGRRHICLSHQTIAFADLRRQQSDC